VPPVRHHVGGASAVGVAATGFRTIPAAGDRYDPEAAIVFRWTPHPGALLYRLEVEDAAGAPILAAVLRAGDDACTAPAWLTDRLPDGGFRWRVHALGAGGRTLAIAPWRTARIGAGFD
jgi:hypothetical protein